MLTSSPPIALALLDPSGRSGEATTILTQGGRTDDGRPLRMLTVLDEYTRECLAIVVARSLKADDVLETLTELFTLYGPPTHIRSDNVLTAKSRVTGSHSYPVDVENIRRRESQGYAIA